MNTNGSSWLYRPKSNPRATFRLFCFPHAGGSAQIFSKWPAALPEHVEVFALSAPGHGPSWNESAISEMGPLVQAVTSAILGHLDKPFALFGHSMGALICFELSRELRRRGSRRPSKLFVAGCRAPDRPDVRRVHNLPDDELLRELQELGGIPNDVLAYTDLLEFLLPTLRADAKLTETYSYTPEAPLSLPITGLAGLEDPIASPAMIERWKEHTSASFSIYRFPGDHFFVGSASAEVLGAISQELLAIADNSAM